MAQSKLTLLVHGALFVKNMKLRGKLLISIGLVLSLSFGLTFYRTAQFQDKLLLESSERQARMLSRQIILTRKWVADHEGLFLVRGPGVEPNPYLEDAIIKDLSGRDLVMRNPAMVTRELSRYTSKADMFTFRVTSLKPINPGNSPDDFEKMALLQLDKGDLEVIGVEVAEGGRVLRFITPLMVDDSCLKCHAKNGYKVGDVRGALSLSIPMNWADQSIRKNTWLLVMIAVVSFLVVGLTIFLVIDAIVVKRMNVLATAMSRFPGEKPEMSQLPEGADEVGTLSRKFFELADRLTLSNDNLAEARDAMFQSEKMASLGRLSAGIAHEVNNPLGGMRNCVKSMRESPDDSQLSIRYLELLDKGLVRVEKTMRQLLNFGRKESLRQRNVQVNEVIEECCELMKYRMNNIELIYDFQLKGEILLDIEAFRQVMVNIIINALHAMPDGGQLTLRTEEHGTDIIINVIDSGIGISEENLRKIFDPFFTTKDIGKGTGLGLSVTYSLVERMMGEITVESKEGVGSCFRIILPKQDDNG